ncbi:RNA polymerase sigma-70 factor, ECF subfamily [Thiothrix eikelboomii]|uniref:RNA polymerase sigma-70 factor, ECF subfamily n=1 Tax=Thiothrix eikelboomii TaxID=92487 RepID=A0A1T4X049_9GAMM|nr:RNA polymerase sigma factor [Thiothrix eikelboomii]SKA82982.1 RNA polymerase sigma-70 factor, ECF subfamily [Thiothrix eikelboomii]
MLVQGIQPQGLVSGDKIASLSDSLGRKEAKEQSLSSPISINHFLASVEKRAFITARLATQNEDDALDIVQDAMLGLVQHYSEHPAVEWGALFHSVLHSKINDWHRRRQVRQRWRVFFHDSAEAEELPEPDELVAQTQFLEPDRQLQNDELSQRLVELIGQLPLRQQQALVLRAWEGYDIAETAKIMGCSEGSVKTHLARAIRQMRDYLGDN